MKTLLCDVNFVLDILFKREPFCAPAAALFEKVEERKLRGYLCALSFPTLYYILARSIKREKAAKALEKLRIVFQVAPVDERVIDQALTSDFKDFEDAVQYYAALRVNADALITRNKADFVAAKIPVMTPEEFLSSLHG